MPVPKRKRSRSRRDKRFANKGYSVPAITFCTNCTRPLQTHQVCSSCGFYKGEKVIVGKLDRLITRAQTRQALQEKRKEQAQSALSENGK